MHIWHLTLSLEFFPRGATSRDSQKILRKCIARETTLELLPTESACSHCKLLEKPKVAWASGEQTLLWFVKWLGWGFSKEESHSKGQWNSKAERETRKKSRSVMSKVFRIKGEKRRLMRVRRLVREKGRMMKPNLQRSQPLTIGQKYWKTLPPISPKQQVETNEGGWQRAVAEGREKGEVEELRSRESISSDDSGERNRHLKMKKVEEEKKLLRVSKTKGRGKEKGSVQEGGEDRREGSRRWGWWWKSQRRPKGKGFGDKKPQDWGWKEEERKEGRRWGESSAWGWREEDKKDD